MADEAGAKTVLMTGGSGFLGGWCIASLLDRGYEVRTTIRDLSREGHVRSQVEVAGSDGGDRLTVLAADLTSDEGWAEAAAGCDYVLHTASPFPPKQPKDPDELIVPARDGALRVLRAALDAGVGRIVMTSLITGRIPDGSLVGMRFSGLLVPEPAHKARIEHVPYFVAEHGAEAGHVLALFVVL